MQIVLLSGRIFIIFLQECSYLCETLNTFSNQSISLDIFVYHFAEVLFLVINSPLPALIVGEARLGWHEMTQKSVQLEVTSISPQRLQWERRRSGRTPSFGDRRRKSADKCSQFSFSSAKTNECLHFCAEIKMFTMMFISPCFIIFQRSLYEAKIRPPSHQNK